MSFLKEAVRNPLKKNNNGISLQDYRDFIFNNIDEFLYEKYLTFIDYNWENNIDYNQTLLEIQRKANNMKLSEALKLLNEHNYLITEARPRPYRQPINMRGFNQERTDKAAFNKLKKDAIKKLNQSKKDRNFSAINNDLLVKYMSKLAKSHNLTYNYSNGYHTLIYNFKLPIYVLFALGLLNMEGSNPFIRLGENITPEFFLLYMPKKSEYYRSIDTNMFYYKYTFQDLIDAYGTTKAKLPVYFLMDISSGAYNNILYIIEDFYNNNKNKYKTIKNDELLFNEMLNDGLSDEIEQFIKWFEDTITKIYSQYLVPLIKKPIVLDPLAFINANIPNVRANAQKILNQ